MTLRHSPSPPTVLFIALAMIFLMGCRSGRNQASPATPKPYAGLLNGLLQQETPADRLWNEGYGFNNPNADRIRQQWKQ